MDLKLKSIAWVGRNISRKFETMCQEVDNFVSQETVKYVENQVLAVGDSMKKIYSEVVQDFDPLLEDPVNDEAQAKENISASNYFKSIIGRFEEETVDTFSKQPHEELEVVDPIKNKVVDAFTQHDLDNQHSAPILETSDDHAMANLPLGHVNDDNVNKPLHEELEVVDPTMNEVIVAFRVDLDKLPGIPISEDSDEHAMANLPSGHVNEDNASKPLHEVVDPTMNEVVDGFSEHDLDKQTSAPILEDSDEHAMANLPSGHVNNDNVNKQPLHELKAIDDPIVNDVVDASSQHDLDKQPSSPTLEDSNEHSTANSPSSHVNDDKVNKQLHEELEVVDPIVNEVVDAFSQHGLDKKPSAPIVENSDEHAMAKLPSGQFNEDLTHGNLEEEKTIKFTASETITLTSPDEKGSSDASLSNFGVYGSIPDVGGVSAVVASTSSVHVVDSQPPQNLNTDDIFVAASDSDTSVALASPVMVPSVGSDGLCESSLEKLPSETNCLKNPVLEAEFVPDVSDAYFSSLLPTITSLKDKAAELIHINYSSVLPPKSIGKDDSEPATNCTGLQAQTCQDSNVMYRRSDHLDTPAITSSDFGSSHDRDDDMDYSKMETIELYSNIKLDDCCPMYDLSAFYAVPYRIPRLRSFKKRIQDAFTSRRRLTKEYEQLGILFGDVDMEPCQASCQTHMPCSISTSSNLDRNNLNSDQVCDSEWELL